LIALKKPSRTGLRNNTENIHYGFNGPGIADVSNASDHLPAADLQKITRREHITVAQDRCIASLYLSLTI